jgi:hypothetical protein
MAIDDDDDDFDFDFDDMTPEEREEFEREHKRKQEERDNHPLFLKAKEIYEVVSSLIESMDEQGREIYGQTLMESAMILAPKLAGAMGSESWLVCMQNGAIIRYHAEYLLISVHGLREFVKTDEAYIKVLRREMEEFRSLFAAWMKEVHAMEDEGFEDDWGLFLRKNLGN